MRKKLSFFMVFVLITLSFAGCTPKDNGKSNKIKIVASVFPVYDWVSNIVKDDANVELSLLVKNGTDLHSFQPSAADLITVIEADVFIYVGGESDKWAKDALEASPNDKRIVINLMDVLGSKAKLEETIEGMESVEGEEDEEEYDEHVWLSLKNAVLFVKSISNTLEAKNPNAASEYSKNTSAYIDELNKLDESYKLAADKAKFKTLMFADRFPFRYLLDDYGIKYFAAFSGCSAETEASFATVTFLATKLDELGLPAVLRIDGSSDKLANTIISNTKNKNQKNYVLDSMQTVSNNDIKNGTTYLGIMRKNLTVLENSLGSNDSAVSPSPTEEASPTSTLTQNPTGNPDPTGIVTEIPGPTGTVTEIPSPTGIVTEIPSPTGIVTETPGPTGIVTETPGPTGATATPAPTKAATATPAPTKAATATPTPTKAATATPAPTKAATATPAPTKAATATPEPTKAATATPEPTKEPTPVPTSTPTPEAGIAWKDSVVEAAVRTALGKSSGSITASEAAGVTSLDLTNKGVKSIADLVYLTGLKKLVLDSNGNIGDFSALKSLTNLEYLSLGYTGFKDLSLISGLTKLKVLCAFNNGITNISSLSGLTGLTELDLDYNSITDLSAISGLTSLKTLKLTQNGISNISALSAISGNLDSLWLGFNNISNISPLAGMKKDAYLNLSANSVSDWSYVSHVKTVTGRKP